MTGLEPRPMHSIRTRIAWLVIAVCTLLFATRAFRDKQSTRGAGRPGAASVELSSALLLSQRALGVSPGEAEQREALDALAVGPLRARLQAAVLGADLLGRAEGAARTDAARSYLEKALADGRVLDPADGRALEILTRLYAAPPDDEEAGPILVERALHISDADRAHLSEQLGALGTLATLPPGTPDDAARSALLRREQFRGLMVIGFGGFLCLLLPISALVLLFVLVRVVGRGVEWRLSAAGQSDGILLEIFALWLAIFALAPLTELLLPAVAVPAGMAAFVLAPTALLWGRRRGVPWRELRRRLGLHRGDGIWREIRAGVFAYVAGLPLLVLGVALSALLASSLSGTALPSDGSHPLVELLRNAGPLLLLVLLFLMAVVAPLVEETFFRGALYRHLRAVTHWLPRGVAVAVSALASGLLFAAVHPQSIVGLPVLTAIGVTFALTREWRDSLIAPMVVHGVSNGLVGCFTWAALG